MSKNSIEIIRREQEYRLLIRNLRKHQEEKNNETANNKKTDSDQPK